MIHWMPADNPNVRKASYTGGLRLTCKPRQERTDSPNRGMDTSDILLTKYYHFIVFEVKTETEVNSPKSVTINKAENYSKLIF